MEACTFIVGTAGEANVSRPRRPTVRDHHPELIGLLERLNGGLVKDNLQPVEDNKLTQERDMPVAELKKRVQSFGGPGNLYGYLLKKRILRLGLRMQCPHCTRHSWFPLDAVRDTFSCPRCLNEFPALNNLEGSLWSCTRPHPQRPELRRRRLRGTPHVAVLRRPKDDDHADDASPELHSREGHNQAGGRFRIVLAGSAG